MGVSIRDVLFRDIKTPTVTQMRDVHIRDKIIKDCILLGSLFTVGTYFSRIVSCLHRTEHSTRSGTLPMEKQMALKLPRSVYSYLVPMRMCVCYMKKLETAISKTSTSTSSEKILLLGELGIRAV
jgi:hypothetical protein